MRVDLHDGKVFVLLGIRGNRCLGNRMLAAECDDELLFLQKRVRCFLEKLKRRFVVLLGEIQRLECRDAQFFVDFPTGFFIIQFNIM